MQVAVIVQPQAGTLREICKRIRAAGFNDRLDFFIQPRTTGRDEDQTTGQTVARYLSKTFAYNDLWRHIVDWWAPVRNGSQHLVILDGSCHFHPNTSEVLSYAIGQPISWGLMSLYVPETVGYYFDNSPIGWSGYSLTMPLIGTCISRHAADIALKNPLLWSEPTESDHFPQTITDPLVRRGCVQAVHYPSLMTTTGVGEPRGLKWSPDIKYKAASQSH